MTLLHASGFRNAGKVYNAVCISLAASLVFWPLLSSILLIFLSAYWIVFVQKKILLSRTRYRLVLLFCLLYLPVIIGTFYSSDIKEAFTQLRIKVPLLAIPVIFGFSNVLNTRIYNNILRSFVGFTLLGCVVCIVAGFITFVESGSADHLHGYELVILKDMPPFIFAFFCLLSVIYLLNEIYRGRLEKRSHKIVFIVLVIFFSMFLFLLGNRSMLLCWMIVMTFYGFSLITGVGRRILLLCLLIAVFVAAVFTNPSLRKQWNDMTNFSDNNTIALDADRSLGRRWGGKAIRIAIWQCSADIIKTNWLTGVGTGDAQQALQNAYENRKFYFASRYNRYNAHNQFIQETIAGGVVALCIFILCLVIPLVLYIRSPEHKPYILFLLCFIIVCLTESFLDISKGVIAYSLFNSLFAFTGIPDGKE